jgi:hypothetical protein
LFKDEDSQVEESVDLGGLKVGFAEPGGKLFELRDLVKEG